MANKNQSIIGNKNINRQWFTLSKPLQRGIRTSIDEEIRKAEVKLDNLKSQKARGVVDKPHMQQINEIDGIPLKFDGYNRKTVALQAVRAKNRNRYDAQEEVVLHWLKQNGFMPKLCSVSMKGAC